MNTNNTVITPRGQIDPRGLGRTADEVERAARSDTPEFGSLVLDRTGRGDTLRDAALKPRFAKILARATNAPPGEPYYGAPAWFYTWAEVVVDASALPPTAPTVVNHTEGSSGVSDQNPLIELAQNVNVPVGAIVPIFPAPSGDAWLFVWVPFACVVKPSGSADSCKRYSAKFQNYSDAACDSPWSDGDDCYAVQIN